MKLAPESPAVGISQTCAFKDAKSFNVKCDCHSPDHDVNMWIELGETDPDFQNVEVSFYVETWSPLWDKHFTRIKMIWDILFKGYHKQEHHLILNKQSAVNFANTIIREVEALEEYSNVGKQKTRKQRTS